MLGIADADGNPNFEGTWKSSRPQTLLTPAIGEPVPFTETGRQLYEQNKAAAAKGDYSYDETQQLCSSPGMPHLMLSPSRLKC